MQARNVPLSQAAEEITHRLAFERQHLTHQLTVIASGQVAGTYSVELLLGSPKVVRAADVRNWVAWACGVPAEQVTVMAFAGIQAEDDEDDGE